MSTSSSALCCLKLISNHLTWTNDSCALILTVLCYVVTSYSCRSIIQIIYYNSISFLLSMVTVTFYSSPHPYLSSWPHASCSILYQRDPSNSVPLTLFLKTINKKVWNWSNGLSMQMRDRLLEEKSGSREPACLDRTFAVGYAMDSWEKWPVVCLVNLAVEDIEDLYLIGTLITGFLLIGLGIALVHRWIKEMRAAVQGPPEAACHDWCGGQSCGYSD